MLASLLAAILAFISTNIDDLFILLILCGRARHVRTIVLGQWLGFGAIVLLSLLVAAGAALLPAAWIGFLGIAPFAIGVKELLELRGDPDDDSSARTRSLGSSIGLVAIATITVANGGDNIAVYAPLFAGRARDHVALMILVFFLMVPAWCALAFRIARLPPVAAALDRWGHVLAPVVLLGLGIYIFIDAGTLTYLLAQIHRP